MSKFLQPLTHKKELLAGAGFGLILGAILYATNPALRNIDISPNSQTNNISTPSVHTILPGSVAPDFRLIDASTNTYVTLSQFNGKPVVLNFWATWCGPCKTEMPHLQEAHNTYSKSELTILAINYAEDPTTVLSFASSLGLTFRTLLDKTGLVQTQYQIRGYPTTVFINTAGKISHTHIGMLQPHMLTQQIEQLLSK